MIVASAFLALPPGCILFIGLPWRRYCLVLAMLVLLTASVAEGYCTLEERLFLARVRHLPPTAPTVYEASWRPNESSFLYYDPSTRELGGGD
jgi:hypothetical protein